MNVTEKDILNLKPGEFKPFVCEDGTKMRSAATTICNVKKFLVLPEGVADYEHRKYEADGTFIVLIHALREGEKKVLKLKKGKL